MKTQPIKNDRIELVEFAKWFHQDFGVLFENGQIGANIYLEKLSNTEKHRLKLEIIKFLDEHPAKNVFSLKKSWLKLGAQWFNAKQLIPILEELTE